MEERLARNGDMVWESQCAADIADSIRMQTPLNSLDPSGGSGSEAGFDPVLASGLHLPRAPAIARAHAQRDLDTSARFSNAQTHTWCVQILRC